MNGKKSNASVASPSHAASSYLKMREKRTKWGLNLSSVVTGIPSLEWRVTSFPSMAPRVRPLLFSSIILPCLQAESSVCKADQLLQLDRGKNITLSKLLFVHRFDASSPFTFSERNERGHVGRERRRGRGIGFPARPSLQPHSCVSVRLTHFTRQMKRRRRASRAVHKLSSK